MINRIKNDKHCYNTSEFGGPCEHNEFFQQGGGETSPEFSYIACSLLQRKIMIDPPLPRIGPTSLHEPFKILVPEDCPVAFPKIKQLSLFS